jgi:hypothetical protein
MIHITVLQSFTSHHLQPYNLSRVGPDLQAKNAGSIFAGGPGSAPIISFDANKIAAFWKGQQRWLTSMS